MTAQLQFFMILGAVALLLIIFAFLKRGLMSVKYSLLWLALAVGLVIFALFPYVVYVLRDLLDIVFPDVLLCAGGFAVPEHCHQPIGRQMQTADTGQRHFGKTCS